MATNSNHNLAMQASHWWTDQIPKTNPTKWLILFWKISRPIIKVPQNMKENPKKKRQHHRSQAAAALAWKPLQHWSAAWLTGKRWRRHVAPTTSKVMSSFHSILPQKLPEEDSKIWLYKSRYIPKCLAEAPAKQTFMRMRRCASGMSCNSCIANIGPKLKVAYNQASWSEKKDDTDIRYVTSPNIYEPLGLVGLKPKNKLLIGMRMAVWAYCTPTHKICWDHSHPSIKH